MMKAAGIIKHLLGHSIGSNESDGTSQGLHKMAFYEEGRELEDERWKPGEQDI